VSERTALTDDLLRQLVSVGQVDILVGIPTFNNAATVSDVAKAVMVSFLKHFPRERTALLNPDGGSHDGTVDLVLHAEPQDLDPRIRMSGLRTIHRISAPHGGLPTRANAVRAIFASADLLQAKAVAVLEPTVTNMAPDWIASLLRPALREEIDFVAPVFLRHPVEGPLVSQLVRPVVRAVYGRRLLEPAATEFGCSGRLASYCLAEPVWDREMAPLGVGLGVCLSAAAGDFRLGQTYLGARNVEPGPDRPHVADVFGQVAGSLFACMEAHEAVWLKAGSPVEVPSFGEAGTPPEESTAIDPAPLVEAYRSGLQDLATLLGPILSPETMAALTAAASDDGPLHVPDEVWVAAIYESAAAHHRQVIHRDHLVKALVPIYLGRAASFLVECGGSAPANVEGRFERLEQVFEAMKPQLIERWSPKTGGER
jgi:glucosylglycerate synthase